MPGHRPSRAACRLAAVAAALYALAPLAAAQSHHPRDLAVGQLLVSRAPVPDGRFRHAVVLLVGLSGKGAAGLVINQPGKTPLARLFPKTPSAQERTDTAYHGGPVAPARLFCLLQIAGPLHEAQAVLPGLYASDNRNLMDLALNAIEPSSAFRVYQGYTGWKPGQLQHEIAAGYWTILPATAALIFDPDPATLWARLSAPPASTARRGGVERTPGFWSGRRDLNSRPLAPQASALPGCATSRNRREGNCGVRPV